MIEGLSAATQAGMVIEAVVNNRTAKIGTVREGDKSVVLERKEVEGGKSDFYLNGVKVEVRITTQLLVNAVRQ